MTEPRRFIATVSGVAAATSATLSVDVPYVSMRRPM